MTYLAACRSPEEPPDSTERPSLVNAVTVDVEDWLQSVMDPDLPLTDRFRADTHRVLEAFARHNIKGTFFVLGLAAEKAPDLVRAIDAAGHEVQSHGYGHRWVHTQSPEEFRRDVDRSKKLLEDIIGRPVVGYRAPAFTIIRDSLWALDVLVETGIAYDSSVFPVRVRWYGIKGAPWFPHRLRTSSGNELVEVPVASYRLFRRRLPLGGGGYFRLAPSRMIHAAIRQTNRAGHAAAIYMHPHEYAPVHRSAAGRSISWRTRMHQGVGRKCFPRKVDSLLSHFAFGTVGDLLNAAGTLPTYQHSQTGCHLVSASIC